MPQNMYEDDARQVSRLCRELIAIRSVTGDIGLSRKALEHVANYLRDTPGLTLRFMEHNNQPSLIVANNETLCPDLLLLGHVDVVPAEESQFSVLEKDGKIFGRGACDMKSGIAAMAWLSRKLATDKSDLSFVLLLTSDEETGGKDGTRHFIEDLGYRPKFAIIPDGGNGPHDIIVENKGIMQVRLTSVGKAAHASRPWEGTNAAEMMMAAVSRISSLFPEKQEADGWADTCTLTKISGGTANNQVPDQAMAIFDIRTTAKTPQDVLFAKIESLAQPCATELLLRGNASGTPETHPLLQAFAALVPKYFGLKPSFNKTPGGNDGRYLAVHGTPLLIVRPPSGGLHGPEEWVDAQGLEDYARLLHEYVVSITGSLKSMPET